MTIRLSFEDFVDLQSRLVLLPRIEEEGIGAIVASYQFSAPQSRQFPNDDGKYQEEKKVDEGEHAVERTNSMDSVSITAEENPGSDNRVVDHNRSGIPGSARRRLETEAAIPLQEINPEHVVGKVLTEITGVEIHREELLVQDFTQILATIRDAKPPLELCFDEPPSIAEDDDSEELNIQQDETEDKLNLALSAWSSWGKRVAATAASSAKEYATVVASAASEVRSTTKQIHYADQAAEFSLQQRCAIFMQKSDGRFVPVCQNSSQRQSNKVTTTSILLLRMASAEPCPKNYSFQWFRSYNTSKSCEMSSSSSRSSSSLSGASLDCPDDQWTILHGATHAAYQPSAIDVGHRLRCVVLCASETDDDNDIMDEDELTAKEGVIVCDLSSVVSADMSLFNGARQALLHGAQFNNLVGRGPAEGRIFGLQIEIGVSEGKFVSSSSKISQIYEGTSELLHSGTIRKASVVVDAANPKNFDLIFPSGLPEQSSMISELSANGHFQLSAPNRITRETILLALGIANYSGKPADLTEKTVLFPGHEDCGDQCDENTPAPVNQVIPAEEVETFCASPPTVGQSSPVSDRVRSLVSGENADHGDRVRSLEMELQQLRSKISKRDKTLSDLRRKFSLTETKLEKTQSNLSSCHQELRKTQEEYKEQNTVLRLTEKRIETYESTLSRVKTDHSKHAAVLEKRIEGQAERISELEKFARSLQNEKAVLSAAVEARDSKLLKMKDLQAALDSLSVKVAKGDSLRSELTEMGKRYEILCRDLEKVAASETECKDQLVKAETRVEELCQNLDSERTKKEQCQKELDSLQKTTQKLKAERNSYKQKADSLTKEISRLCRCGRTLRDVERVLVDEDSRKIEIEVLRTQKKKALEDLHQYRTAYEQQLVAQLNLGVDGAAVKALEQNAELERVVSELTEYVNAKEMQLETMRQVNETLTEDLKQLAKVNMSKDEI